MTLTLLNNTGKLLCRAVCLEWIEVMHAREGYHRHDVSSVQHMEEVGKHNGDMYYL